MRVSESHLHTIPPKMFRVPLGWGNIKFCQTPLNFKILNHAASRVIKLLTSNKCSCTTEKMGYLFFFCCDYYFDRDQPLPLLSSLKLPDLHGLLQEPSKTAPSSSSFFWTGSVKKTNHSMKVTRAIR